MYVFSVLYYLCIRDFTKSCFMQCLYIQKDTSHTRIKKLLGDFKDQVIMTTTVTTIRIEKSLKFGFCFNPYCFSLTFSFLCCKTMPGAPKLVSTPVVNVYYILCTYVCYTSAIWIRSILMVQVHRLYC